MKKRIVSFLLCLSLLFSVVSVLGTTAHAAGTPITVENRYGRQALAALPNGERYVKVYDALYEAISEHRVYSGNGTDYLSFEDCMVSVKEFSGILEAYRSDVPENFWMDFFYLPYGYYTDESLPADLPEEERRMVFGVVPQYVFDEDEWVTAKAEAEAVVQEMLDSVAGMSDRDAILKLHDDLAERVVYMETTNAHNAYGALVNGKCVCEGYARAYQILLNRLGIPCLTVPGVGTTSKGDEPHAWNMLCIDGSWVQTDVTWDDGTPVFHYYYNCTDAQILQDHTQDGLPYDLPACTDDSYRWFTEDNSLTELDVDRIAALLAGNISGNRAECAIEYTGAESIDSWLSKNAAAIAEKLQISGDAGYSRISKGKEYRIYFTQSNGDIPTDCLYDEHTYLHGVCTRCGEKMFRIGDINDDGEIDSLDGLLLMRYLNGWDVEIAVEEAMDANADGIVDSLDGLLLMRYLNGWDVTLGKAG